MSFQGQEITWLPYLALGLTFGGEFPNSNIGHIPVVRIFQRSVLSRLDTSDLRLLHCALIYVGDLLSMGCTMPFPNRPITFYSNGYSAWMHSYA